MSQTRASARLAAPHRLLSFGFGFVCLSAVLSFGSLAEAEETITEDLVVSHGYSFYGDLKYGPDFEHFDFVNPEAPKGGEISFAALGTFDSMNPYPGKGRRGKLGWYM